MNWEKKDTTLKQSSMTNNFERINRKQATSGSIYKEMASWSYLLVDEKYSDFLT